MSRVRSRRLFRHGLLPQLLVFEAVARLGSVTRAAEELHLAQPTVSLQLKKLAEALEVQLFEQRGRKLHLTGAGHALREGCRTLRITAEPLPGGEFPVERIAAQVDQLINRYGFLSRPHAARLVRMYGTRAKDMLGAARSVADLGRDFGATLTQAEIDYLMREEWAERAEDVLWRRSKLGLRLDAGQAAAIEDAMQARRRNAAPLQASAGGRP